MPLKSDTVDILGYYDDSWWVERPEETEIKSFAVSVQETLAAMEIPYERWPVRNREPRTPIDSQKRAIIHERDGGRCWMCGTVGHVLTVDHIIPRSAFLPEDLDAADRSDNLISACWDCNQKKSNYERHQRKRLGVVVKCWYCMNPHHGEGEDSFLPHPVTIQVYCGRCGISNVPTVKGWVL